jgi:hypothetical protein
VSEKAGLLSTERLKNSGSPQKFEKLSSIQSSAGISQHLFLDVSTELLQCGHSVRFQAPGRSMHPTIKEGETITVEPVQPPAVRTGDIVLYRTEAGVIAHRVIRIERRDSSSEAALRAQEQGVKPRPSPSQSSALSAQQLFFLRGDASANCDRPIEGGHILGKVVSVERDGRLIDPYGTNARVMYLTRLGVFWVKNWIKGALVWRGTFLM